MFSYFRFFLVVFLKAPRKEWLHETPSKGEFLLTIMMIVDKKMSQA